MRAEVGAAVSVANDLRFRGYSLSAGQPVGTLDLAYDDPSGLYASLSGTAVAEDGIEPLRAELGAGYVRRFASGVTLDLGIVHSRYSHYSSQAKSNSYTEVYAGIGRKALSSRIYFSPHYFDRGTSTIYGEIDGTVSPARRLELSGHLGLLVPIRTTAAEGAYRAQYDWSIGAARELGRASLHVTLSGGGAGRGFYREYRRRRTALVFALSYAL